MNFLADESCTGPVLRALREAGHDVVAIGEVARGATDEQVLERALGHVPHLRCSAFLYTTHPALTRWAKVCRAYGAGRNANSPFSSQRLRAGLKYVAPTALEETQILPSPPLRAGLKYAAPTALEERQI